MKFMFASELVRTLETYLKRETAAVLEKIEALTRDEK
jgi:uncharacterized protein (DUF2164 family)